MKKIGLKSYPVIKDIGMPDHNKMKYVLSDGLHLRAYYIVSSCLYHRLLGST